MYKRQYQIRQNRSGVLLVVSHLGTSIRMRECDDFLNASLHAGVGCLRHCGCNIVDTADSRDDPDFVADANFSVGAGEAHEFDILDVYKRQVERPVRVLQFGEGNFLRAFVDYMIDIANEQGRFNGDIVLVKPIEFGSLDRFHEQECQYTVQLRGIVDGEPKRINRIVTSVADAVDAYGEYEKYAAFAKLDTLRYICLLYTSILQR